MTKQQFLISNGWRMFSFSFDQVVFRKDDKETTNVNRALAMEFDLSGKEYRQSDNYIESPINHWKPVPVFEICLNCGSQNYSSYTSEFLFFAPNDQEKTSCVVHCGDCKTIRPTVWRDADGNALAYSEDMTGKYSYATDSVWHSKRALADHCQRHGLVQKGNDVNTKDKRLRRS